MIRPALCVIALAYAAPVAAQQAEPATIIRETQLLTGPNGTVTAIVQPGTPVEIVARDGDWVRVRGEGWVRATDIVPADAEVLGIRSAADLRADPEGTRGKIVRWDVEVIAFQTADALRRDLGANEPYLLARGPGNENSLLYLAVPARLLASARALPSLARVTVVARVRTGRSEPVGVPVLDIETMNRRP